MTELSKHIGANTVPAGDIGLEEEKLDTCLVNIKD
jgi:glutamate dehydrogenase/leucine dehydrogenase